MTHYRIFYWKYLASAITFSGMGGKLDSVFTECKMENLGKMKKERVKLEADTGKKARSVYLWLPFFGLMI